MDPGLYVILDAVPYEMARTLHDRGALGDLGPPRPMVAPFPSLTNVGVPALVHGISGVRPPGIEPLWFHPPTRERRGGVATAEAADVLSLFRGTPQSSAGQIAEYFLSSHAAYHEVRWFARQVGPGPEAWLGWVSATDAIGHFEGEGPMMLAAADVMHTVRRAAKRLAQRSGREPTVVLASDHGMAFGALQHLGAADLAAALEQAAVAETVLVAHGEVAVGAVHCSVDRAADVARVVAAQPGVDLAVALTGPCEAIVVSRRGEARVDWAEGQTRTSGPADVLGLGALRDRWIDDRDLLRATWHMRYPAGPSRIRDALTNRWVQYPAPVLFSMDDGWTYGPRLTHAAAMLGGGQVGTHGALSGVQSLGFAATNRPERWPEGPLAVGDVFAPWAG